MGGRSSWGVTTKIPQYLPTIWTFCPWILCHKFQYFNVLSVSAKRHMLKKNFAQIIKSVLFNYIFSWFLNKTSNFKSMKGNFFCKKLLFSPADFWKLWNGEFVMFLFHKIRGTFHRFPYTPLPISAGAKRAINNRPILSVKSLIQKVIGCSCSEVDDGLVI